MMRLVIDSNIFVSSLEPKDIFHNQCLPIFKKILKNKIEAVCPLIILAETICILRRRTDDEILSMDVYKALSRLPSIEWLSLSIDMVEKACILGCKNSLKGADAIVLHTAEHYGIPLLTNDKEIKSRTPKNIIVITPLELNF